MAVNSTVDENAMATERGGEDRIRSATKGDVNCLGDVGTNERTWVGGKADYPRASKAVAVAALGTDEEGRGTGRGIPPTLEAGDVYVLFQQQTT
jgi:hypothetical protein